MLFDLSKIVEKYIHINMKLKYKKDTYSSTINIVREQTFCYIAIFTEMPWCGSTIIPTIMHKNYWYFTFLKLPSANSKNLIFSINDNIYIYSEGELQHQLKFIADHDKIVDIKNDVILSKHYIFDIKTLQSYKISEIPDGVKWYEINNCIK